MLPAALRCQTSTLSLQPMGPSLHAQSSGWRVYLVRGGIEGLGLGRHEVAEAGRYQSSISEVYSLAFDDMDLGLGFDIQC